ncbi:hypothetical protein D3C86_1696340 [compost metagenome]
MVDPLPARAVGKFPSGEGISEDLEVGVAFGEHGVTSRLLLGTERSRSERASVNPGLPGVPMPEHPLGVGLDGQREKRPVAVGKAELDS